MDVRENSLETFELAEALELLPAPRRLQKAQEDAENDQRQASFKKALASARDLLEVASQQNSGPAQARAHLLMGIALRRSGDWTQAREQYQNCSQVLAPLLNNGVVALQKAAAEIQIDLHLEEAIYLFFQEDFIESARKNERAAKLASALLKNESACRAWLNAAVSWDRAQEVREAKACLTKGTALLAKLPESTLQASYLLFSWKLGMDHGPLVKPAALPPQATLSQKTLYLLYGWEHSLMTDSFSETEKARAKLFAHLNDAQEKQFSSEIEALSSFSERLHLGRGKARETSYHLAANLQELFIKGSWKKLEVQAHQATQQTHPANQAWGYRALAWVQARNKSVDLAKTSLTQALTIARTQGMVHLVRCIEQELSEAPELLELYSAQERKVAHKWASLLPARKDQLLAFTQNGHKAITSDEAHTLLDEALRGSGAHASALLIDGARQLIRVPQKNKTASLIQIEKLPIQRKLLFTLVAAYPNALSKEDLVSQVWDELYNPLTHDTVLYRTSSRLRKLLGGSWISFESGALRLNPEGRPFLAILPADEASLRQSPLDERKIRILTLLKYRGRVTRTEAVKALNAPERTVARDLAYLVDQKLVVRQGAGRGTVYVPAL
ncbi:MAG: hypothetical protein ACJ763_07350 [Bdellovibrionia bacterium]